MYRQGGKGPARYAGAGLLLSAPAPLPRQPSQRHSVAWAGRASVCNGRDAADEKETNALVDALEATMLDALRNGRHNTFSEVTNVPGGLTEINGTFYLSDVARACLDAIARADYQLIPSKGNVLARDRKSEARTSVPVQQSEVPRWK
jgi:hypothetical protein